MQVLETLKRRDAGAALDKSMQTALQFFLNCLNTRILTFVSRLHLKKFWQRLRILTQSESSTKPQVFSGFSTFLSIMIAAFCNSIVADIADLDCKQFKSSPCLVATNWNHGS